MALLYKTAPNDARVSERIRGRSASRDSTVHIGILGGCRHFMPGLFANATGIDTHHSV